MADERTLTEAWGLSLHCPLLPPRSAVSDISQPSRASGDTERKGRILRLKLTDGRSSCVAIEFAPLPYSLEQVGRWRGCSGHVARPDRCSLGFCAGMA